MGGNADILLESIYICSLFCHLFKFVLQNNNFINYFNRNLYICLGWGKKKVNEIVYSPTFFLLIECEYKS